MHYYYNVCVCVSTLARTASDDRVIIARKWRGRDPALEGCSASEGTADRQLHMAPVMAQVGQWARHAPGRPCSHDNDNDIVIVFV